MRIKYSDHTVISGLTIRNGRIASSSGEGDDGGGIYISNCDSVRLEHLVIEDNYAEGAGGGVSSNTDYFVMEHCRVKNNMVDGDYSPAGGIYSRSSNSYFNECIVEGNTGTRCGGADISDATIVNSIFRNNVMTETSWAYGGAIITRSTMINCLVTGNTNGGLTSSTTNYLYNVTIANNTVSGLVVGGSTETILVNSIVYANETNIELPSEGAKLTINYSNIDGGEEDIEIDDGIVIWGDGNISDDPLFTAAGSGDFSLDNGSPSIDTGHPNGIYNDTDGTRNDMGYNGGTGLFIDETELDFGYGNLNNTNTQSFTITNGRAAAIILDSYSVPEGSPFSTETSFPVTIGSISTTPDDYSSTISFNFTPTAIGTYSQALVITSDDIPGSPFEIDLSGIAVDISGGVVNVPDQIPTIQDAIGLSQDGDTVLVSAGTYAENISFNGKNIVVLGEDRETTIIDGGNQGTVVNFGDYSDNLEDALDTSAVLAGFTIRNGSGAMGGGISLIYCSPILRDLIIEENYGTQAGGIYAEYKAGHDEWGDDEPGTVLENIIIRNNQSNWCSGVFIKTANYEWPPYIEKIKLNNLLIENNDIGIPGAGPIDGDYVILKNSIIRDNVGGNNGGGGGAFNNATLINVLVEGNR
ncbi:uncharacterized protein METZ01_LOCUS180364, partial [marine metagenome]